MSECRCFEVGGPFIAEDPSCLEHGADQFKPPVLPHRQGYGDLTYQGRTYTPLEWVEYIARRGGTLAANEGKLLMDKIDHLESTIDTLEARLYAARSD